MWIATVAIIVQLFYNLEAGRYAIYCGEPVFTGFMRLKPGPAFWITGTLLLSIGALIPGLASHAATIIAAFFLDRPPLDAEEVTEPSPDELFYQAMNAGVDPTSSSAFQSLIADVEEIGNQTTTELELVELAGGRTKIHTNEWRAPDGRAAGLDSWVELHYNWVHMDASSTFEVGGSASGEFNLTFDAAESQSRLFIQGSFVVEEIKADRWVTDDIQAIKLEENGTVLCGE